MYACMYILYHITISSILSYYVTLYPVLLFYVLLSYVKLYHVMFDLTLLYGEKSWYVCTQYVEPNNINNNVLIKPKVKTDISVKC